MDKSISIMKGLSEYLATQKTSVKTFKWCNYKWSACMEGGRRIHPEMPWMWYDDAQISLDEDGVLYLDIQEKPTTIRHWNHETYTPTIATGVARSVEAFDFGTFFADIMVPKGYNLWPSFWLSGEHNWPPEIDIMEAWSGNNRYFRMLRPQFPYIYPSWKTTTNVHFNEDTLRKNNIGSRNISICKQPFSPSDSWVSYVCEWHRDHIRLYANGHLVRSVDKDICNKLFNNLVNPDGGYKMNVIFNVWCENPVKYDVKLLTQMKIKNFIYIPD